jgi:hypothetical protein
MIYSEMLLTKMEGFKMITTYDEWAKGKPLNTGDQIDEEIFMYFLEVLPPIYIKNDDKLFIFQCSEPDDHDPKTGCLRYSTFKNDKYNGKYWYEGILTTRAVKEKYV